MTVADRHCELLTASGAMADALVGLCRWKRRTGKSDHWANAELQETRGPWSVVKDGIGGVDGHVCSQWLERADWAISISATRAGRRSASGLATLKGNANDT